MRDGQTCIIIYLDIFLAMVWLFIRECISVMSNVVGYQRRLVKWKVGLVSKEG